MTKRVDAYLRQQYHRLTYWIHTNFEDALWLCVQGVCFLIFLWLYLFGGLPS